jgi:hypothetical protein
MLLPRPFVVEAFHFSVSKSSSLGSGSLLAACGDVPRFLIPHIPQQKLAAGRFCL